MPTDTTTDNPPTDPGDPTVADPPTLGESKDETPPTTQPTTPPVPPHRMTEAQKVADLQARVILLEEVTAKFVQFMKDYPNIHAGYFGAS